MRARLTSYLAACERRSWPCAPSGYSVLAVRSNGGSQSVAANSCSAAIAVLGLRSQDRRFVDPFLPGLIAGDGQGHHLLKRQIAIAVQLNQFCRNRAQPEALSHHMRRHPQREAIASAAKPRSSASLLNASNWSAGCMFSRVTFSSRLIFVRVIRGVDDATDQLGLLDLLSLHPQQLGKPPTLDDGHEIDPRGHSLTVQLGLNHQILQETFAAILAA